MLPSNSDSNPDHLWSVLALHRAYDRTLPLWHEYRALVGEFTAFMRPAKCVLDAGCGTGMLAEHLATAGRWVVGVDRNAEMIRVAQERAKHTSNVNFCVADVNCLPYAAESFDGAVSSNVLFAVEDPERYLTELRRLLRGGGRLALSGPTPRAAGLVDELCEDLQTAVRAAGRQGALHRELAVVREVNQSLARRGFGWTYAAAELERLLCKLGFRIEWQHERLYRSSLFFVAAIKASP